MNLIIRHRRILLGCGRWFVCLCMCFRRLCLCDILCSRFGFELALLFGLLGLWLLRVGRLGLLLLLGLGAFWDCRTFGVWVSVRVSVTCFLFALLKKVMVGCYTFLLLVSISLFSFALATG